MGLLRLLGGVGAALCTVALTYLTFNVPTDQAALHGFHLIVVGLCLVGIVGVAASSLADYRMGLQRDAVDRERDRREKLRDDRENKRDDLIRSLVDGIALHAPGDLKQLLVQSVAYVQRLWDFIRERDSDYGRKINEKGPLRDDLEAQLSDAFFNASKGRFDSSLRPELDSLLPRLRSAGLDTSNVERDLIGEGEPLSAYVENLAYSVDDLVQKLILEVYSSPPKHLGN